MTFSDANKYKLARAGLFLLVLSPFSIISNWSQLLIALASLCLRAPKKIIFPADTKLPSVRLLLYLQLIFLCTFLGSLISFAELLATGEVGLGEVLSRWGVQLFALFLSLFQVLCGFFMAQRYGNDIIRRAIIIPFIIIICVAGYQFIAIASGLPYFGKFVFDKFVGLRPSSLALEPKYLSGYLACMVFYFGFLLFEATHSVKLVLSAGILVSLYFFVVAASANGAIIFVLLLVFKIISSRSKWPSMLLIVTALVIPMASTQLDLEELGLRGSHKELIENIDTIDLSLLDDLIALPLLAWRDNPGKVIVGFGPGLMHFFGKRHIDQATWLTEDTYIEGNVSFLMYTSNFGVLVYGLLLIAISIQAVSRLRKPPRNFQPSTAFFFASAFISGALISGNVSVPLFISIGWILGSNVIRHRAPKTAQSPAALESSPI